MALSYANKILYNLAKAGDSLVSLGGILKSKNLYAWHKSITSFV
ncbi:hypothetical protein [Helicobacter pullorum]|nr:hypothetical protein [Helicobacter pullorum]